MGKGKSEACHKKGADCNSWSVGEVVSLFRIKCTGSTSFDFHVASWKFIIFTPALMCSLHLKKFTNKKKQTNDECVDYYSRRQPMKWYAIIEQTFLSSVTFNSHKCMQSSCVIVTLTAHEAGVHLFHSKHKEKETNQQQQQRNAKERQNHTKFKAQCVWTVPVFRFTPTHGHTVLLLFHICINLWLTKGVPIQDLTCFPSLHCICSQFSFASSKEMDACFSGSVWLVILHSESNSSPIRYVTHAIRSPER